MGVGSLKRAIFFDRDGVLNDAVVRNGKPYPPASLEHVRVTPYAPKAVQMLRQHGFAAVVVTNQPDVARGMQCRQVVEQINEIVATTVGADAVYTCYHDDIDGCDCRKPKPGLLHRAAEELGLDLNASYLIGDRKKDILAGRAAGCKTAFIDFGYNETAAGCSPDITVRSLEDAVRQILARERIQFSG